MKKVIITGAGGFIGSELTKRYISAGYKVIAISTYFNSTFPEHFNIERHNSKITSSSHLLEILTDKDYEAFYHLAWRGVNGSEKADPQIQLDNIKLVLNCADVAKKVGCKKFLCAGTVAERSVESLHNIENTSGGMIYGVAKHTAHLILETYCKNIGLNFVWMQFSNIYGPQNKTGNLVSYTLTELSKGREATFGPALQPYDFIFIDDLIEAVYRLGTNETSKNFYVIGSGNPKLLKDYLIQIGEEYGRPDLIKIGARPDDGIVYSADMFDVQDLVEDIGVYNKIDFDDGIRITIKGFKSM